MHTWRLHRHVRKEARLLVRDAKRLGASSKRPEVADVETALKKRDLAAVRAAIPALDDIVEDAAKKAKPALHHQAYDAAMWVIQLAVLVFGIRAFVVQVFQIPSSSMYPTLMIGDHLFVNKFIYGLDIPFSEHKLATRSPSRGEVIVFAQPCQPERDYIKRVIAVAGDTVEVRCNRVYVNGQVIPETRVDDPSCAYEDRNDDGTWHTEQCSRYRETHGGYSYETFHDPRRPATDADRTIGEADFPSLSDRTIKDCHDDPQGQPADNQLPGELVEGKPGGACDQQLAYRVPEGHVFAMGDNRAHSNDSRFWGSVPLENIRGKAMFIWLSYHDFSFSGLRPSRMGNFVHHSK